MSLNIKNQETCELARELAELTNDTMTSAITIALQERLEHVKRKRDQEDFIRKLEAISDRCAALLGPGPSAVEHGDFIYDDLGLPK